MQFLRCVRDDAKVQKRKFGFFTYMCSLPSSAREKITISVCIIDEQTLRFHLCIQRFANEECTRKMYWDFARNRGNHLKNSLIKNCEILYYFKLKLYNKKSIIDIIFSKYFSQEFHFTFCVS